MWHFVFVIWANWPIKGFFKHCSHLSLSHLYNPTLTWQIRSKTFWQTFWTKWTSPSSEPQDSVHDSAQNKVLFTGRLRKMRRIVILFSEKLADVKILCWEKTCILVREKKTKRIFQILLNQKGRLFNLYGADFRPDINNYETIFP